MRCSMPRNPRKLYRCTDETGTVRYATSLKDAKLLCGYDGDWEHVDVPTSARKWVELLNRELRYAR